MEVTPSVLLDRLKWDTKSILNIYQWGSRVYGCARPDSDWDFVIVTKDEDESLVDPIPRNLLNDIDKTYPVIEDDVINVTFIPLSHFISLVREHRHEALECVFLPSHFVWQHKAEIPVDIDVDILRKTVSWEAARRFQTAKNRFRNGETIRGKKEIVHACRYLLFASQIAKEGKIYDYGAANHILESILQVDSECEALFAKYYEVLLKLKEEFKLYTVFHKFYGSFETERNSLQLYKRQFTKDNKSKLTPLIRNVPQNPIQINYNDIPLLDIIRSKTLELHNIERHYGLLTRPHTQYPHLMLFTFIGHSNDMHVSRDCKGLVVDLNTGDPVCIPIPIIPHYNSTMQFNWTSATAHEYIDGVSANMYWYSGEWHLASIYEPNDPQAPMNFKDEKDVITFSILFWDLWKLRSYQLPSNKEMCYNFVIGTKRHRHVIRYPEDDIYLVGARELKTRKVMNIDQIAGIMGNAKNEYGWKVPNRMENVSLESLQTRLVNKNPFVVGGRGYIVQDDMNRLVKVGSKQFISVSYGTDFGGSGGFNLNCEMDERQMVELIRVDKLDTFLMYHPQWKSFANKMLDLYSSLEASIQNTFDSIVIESGNKRKEFAERAKKNKNSVPLFSLCEDYSSAHQFLTLIEEKQFWKLWRENIN